MRSDAGFTRKRFGILSIALLGVWAVFAWLVVPALIRSAYRGESISFLNRIITGQSVHPVERYLDSWSAVAVAVTVGSAALLAAVYLLLAFGIPGRLRRWHARYREREASLEGRPPRLSGWGYLLLVVWCGVGAGLVEALYLSKKMLFGGRLITQMAQSASLAWLAPVSYLIVCGLIGLPLLLIARSRPGWLSVKRVLFAASFLALFSILRLPTGRLQLYGAIPLAAGISLVAARLGAAYSDAFVRFVKRSLPVTLAAVVAILAGLAVQHRVAERAARAALPAGSADDPNVLLLILDTVRARSLSVYGYDRPTTPALERFAGRGVTFEHAVAPAPWTLPSHATLFTGRHPHELSVNWRKPLDDTYPTLAEVLRARGYATGGFVANLFYCGPHFGLNRGFSRYRDAPVTLSGIIASGWLGRELLRRARHLLGNHQDLVRKTADDVNREFLNWLDGTDPSRPFFGFLNYFDAHSPYRPPEPWDLRFSETPPRYWLKDSGAEYTDQELRELTAAYDGSIAYLDEQLGVLFDELDARGLLDNTLIIITSDHGEQFGEHRLMYHSNSLYMPLLHVPLLMAYPGRLPAGRRIHEPVALRDIPVTVTDLIGLPASPFPGRTLSPVWAAAPDGEETPAGVGVGGQRVVLSEVSGNTQIPAWMPAAYGPMQSLVAGRFHYIRRGDGAEELYDWIADPEESADLSGSRDRGPQLAELRARLDSLLQSSGDAGSGSASFPSSAPADSAAVRASVAAVPAESAAVRASGTASPSAGSSSR